MHPALAPGLFPSYYWLLHIYALIISGTNTHNGSDVPVISRRSVFCFASFPIRDTRKQLRATNELIYEGALTPFVTSQREDQEERLFLSFPRVTQELSKKCPLQHPLPDNT